MSQMCDRCEIKHVSGHRGDFFFCSNCLPVIDAQVQLNEASVRLSDAETAIKRAQEYLEANT